MPISIIGRKCGMTRVFTEDGASIPVTVIAVEPNRVTQVKTPETDGYWGIQVTTGQRTSKHVNQPMTGHFKKAGVEAGRGLWEFRLDTTEVGEAPGQSPFNVGDVIDVTRFAEGQIVDVAGISRGKGYAGTIKRWNFKSQRASHGNSVSHRAPGSIGQNQTPGRVFKGKKMSGHLGDERCTVQSQEVIRIDGEKGLLLLKGAVPGAPGGNVIIKPAVKAKKKGNQ